MLNNTTTQRNTQSPTQGVNRLVFCAEENKKTALLICPQLKTSMRVSRVCTAQVQFLKFGNSSYNVTRIPKLQKLDVAKYWKCGLGKLTALV